MSTNYNTAQLAEYLQISRRTLERWRLSGDGPAYLKLGSRVLYSSEQVERWLANCETVSTSQQIVNEERDSYDSYE